MQKMSALLLIILCSYTFGQQLKVLSVSPAQDTIGASVNSKIQVTLNQSIDSLHFDENSLFKVFGSCSGIIKGNIEIESQNNTINFLPVKPFLVGEIINVCFGPVLSGKIDTLKSFNYKFIIGVTNQTSARFDSIKTFDNLSINPVPIDYNNDGYVDIFSTYSRSLLLNNHDGGFNQPIYMPEIAEETYFCNINNDSLVDVVCQDQVSLQFIVLLGNKYGNFDRYLYYYPIPDLGGKILAVGDVNGDGYSDLLTEEIDESNDICYLHIFFNNQRGLFYENKMIFSLRPLVVSARLVDMNKDGFLDVVLINRGSAYQDYDGAYILYNNKYNSFTEVKHILFRYSINGGISAGFRQMDVNDYSGNGLNDIAAFSWQEGGMVMIQDSFNSFVGYTSTYFWGAENCGFFGSGDVNGDNLTDIVITNLQACTECGEEAEVNCAVKINNQGNYFNTNNTTFRNLFLGTRNQVGSLLSPIMIDIDNDGDLDIINCGSKTTICYNYEKPNSVVNELNNNVTFELYQNYPNPFNPSTTITYQVPSSCHVSLKIYDILGREITTLVDEYKSKGRYDIQFNSKNLSSGTYIYQLKAGGFINSRKTIIFK